MMVRDRVVKWSRWSRRLDRYFLSRQVRSPLSTWSKAGPGRAERTGTAECDLDGKRFDNKHGDNKGTYRLSKRLEMLLFVKVGTNMRLKAFS
jgi:hypothetical protein